MTHGIKYRRTDYVSRCPSCGVKEPYQVRKDKTIRCAECGNIVGTVVSPELQVTILCSFHKLPEALP